MQLDNHENIDFGSFKTKRQISFKKNGNVLFPNVMIFFWLSPTFKPLLYNILLGLYHPFITLLKMFNKIQILFIVYTGLKAGDSQFLYFVIYQLFIKKIESMSLIILKHENTLMLLFSFSNIWIYDK